MLEGGAVDVVVGCVVVVDDVGTVTGATVDEGTGAPAVVTVAGAVTDAAIEKEYAPVDS